MFDSGKVAIVTGIGPGMGASIAAGFASQGVDVALAARRPERLQAEAEKIRALGREPLVFPLDITDQQGCRDLVAATVERFGGVDFVVQNAHDEGDWTFCIDADLDRWRQVFEVNFFGALGLVQAAFPEMRKRGEGAIVLISSGAAINAPPAMAPYAASKAALGSLTRSLAKELGGFGIRTNAVLLGATAGDTLDAAAIKVSQLEGITPGQWMVNRSREYALGYIPTPDECAGAVLFLCSQFGKSITGQQIAVNNGQWM
jgi:NAD(P)-dependent dehydrogenase (short-subunit alcohol dehydrogenase family)